MPKPALLALAEFLPARFVMLLLGLVPGRLATRAGAAFGRLVWLLAPGQRRVTRRNLALAYGDALDPRERNRIGRASFVNLGKTIFEFMQFPKLTCGRILKRVRFVNVGAMDRALAGGRGVIAITGHFANWEMFAAAFASSGRPLAAIVRPLDNRLLDRTVERLRADKGVQVVPRGVALKRGLAALRQGKVLAFLMDQNAARNGIFVPFFGRPAATVAGPAALALRLDVPVLFCHARRAEGGMLELVFSDPVAAVRDRATEDENIAATTARYNTLIEAAVRERPDEWLWMHPRWRTEPPAGLSVSGVN